MIEFQEFPKIGRLSRDMVITEKIDGTNASITIAPFEGEPCNPMIAVSRELGLAMYAGSRSRFITIANDNYGFARWATEHVGELFELGEGTHFGEWWGSGIQRRYGLSEKRFSLFNVGRWLDPHTSVGEHGKQRLAPACCHVVPVLMRWTFDSQVITETLDKLKAHGSYAAPGFMNPEGVVVFHSASGTLFKKTLEKDDEWKGRSAQPASINAVDPVGGITTG